MTTLAEARKPHETLRLLAPMIAVELGPTWKAKLSDDADTWVGHHLVDDSTGMSIYLSTSDGKVHATGEFTTRVDGKYVWSPPSGKNGRPSIGCSIDKTAAAIARDVRRRLLPVYGPLWEENLAAINEHYRHEINTRGTARALSQLVGAPEPEIRDYRAKVDVYHSTALPEALFNLTVSEGTVRFDGLDVSLGLASQILALLRAERKERK